MTVIFLGRCWPASYLYREKKSEDEGDVALCEVIIKSAIMIITVPETWLKDVATGVSIMFGQLFFFGGGWRPRR